jgi:FKBP-type peptidyl-prolyl cis-trans isomerase
MCAWRYRYRGLLSILEGLGSYMGKGFFRISLASAVAAVVLVAGCVDGASGSAQKAKFNPENELHQTSYMVGRDIGRTLKEMDAGLDIDIVMKAFLEVVNDVPAQLSDSALAAIDMRFRRELQELRRRRQEEAEAKSLEEARAFLEANKNNPGVVVTESGLQYVVITEGTGPKPTATDRVRVHYHGTLTDGTVFDSSVDRGEPAVFPLNSVIMGWTEALQLMSTGSKYRLFIPPELAYGRQGMRRGNIGPNAALIFEVELLGIGEE